MLLKNLFVAHTAVTIMETATVALLGLKILQDTRTETAITTQRAIRSRAKTAMFPNLILMHGHIFLWAKRGISYHTTQKNSKARELPKFFVQPGQLSCFISVMTTS